VRELLGRALMLLGLLVTGMALFLGLFGGHPFLLSRLGGPIRADLTVLAVGAGLFFLGTAVAGMRR